MPQVTIPGIGNVNFPDAMSDQEIMAQARAMQEKANQPIFDPKDLGIGQLISGGFGRSVESLKGTALDLIPALGASISGRERYAKDQLKEYSERMAAAEELYPTAYKSYKDISGIGSILPFAAETIGELGPDIAGFMLGAGVGTYGGKKIALNALEKQVRAEAAEFAAKKKLSAEAAQDYADRLVARTQAGQIGTRVAGTGKDIGLKTGLGATSAGINIPDVFQSIYEDTGELAPGVALTIGSLVAALDTYLPSKILSQLGPKGKERIAKEMLDKSKVVPTTWKKAFGAEILKTSSGEALTEAGQEALTKFASQIAGSKDPFFSEKNIDQIITSSLKGFIGGGVFGTPGAALEAKRITDERNRLVAQQKAAQEDQAVQQFSSLQQTQPDLFGEQGLATPYNARQDQALTPRQQDIAALQQAKAMQQLPTAESPRFYQEQQAAQPSPGQQALDLQGGMTPEQQIVAERDRQNQEMNQLYIEEAQQQLQQARERATIAKEILDEEIFLTDERVRLGEIKRTEAERINLLLPIINNLERGTEDSITLFQQALRRAGYNNLELTEAEQRLLQRADDVKTAIALSLQGELDLQELEYSAANQLTPAITGIKEKGEKGPAGTPKPAEPGQLKLDLGPLKTPRARPTPTEEAAPEAAPSTVLDTNTLDSIGLPKQSGYYRQLANKDVANPADQEAVRNILAAVRQNPNLSPFTKQAIESIAIQAFNALATQQTFLGPRGGILKGADYGRVRSGPTGGVSGAGVPVPSGQAPTEPAKRTRAPKQQRVGSTTEPVDKSRSGEKLPSSTLKKKADVLEHDGIEYADTPRIRALIEKAKAIQTKLPSVKAGMVRLYRGNREGEVGQNPSFTNSLVGIALPFQESYGGSLSYVDIPEADLSSYDAGPGGAPGAEFILPKEIANKAKPVTPAKEQKAKPAAPAKKATTEPENIPVNAYTKALRKRIGIVNDKLRTETDPTEKELLRDELEELKLSLSEAAITPDTSANNEVAAELGKLDEAEINALETHYGAARNSEEFLANVKEDVLSYVNKGASAVAKAIRDIIQKIANGLLSVAVVFNASALQPDLFNVPQAFAETRNVSISAPANVPMSDIAKTTYSLSAPVAIKNKQALFIADKPNGMVHMFDDKGQFIASSNALYGKQAGDILTEESRNKPIEKMTTVDKVTPAGTYKLSFSKDLSGDYAGGYTLRFEDAKGDLGGIAVHSVYLGDIKEDRLKKLSSTNLADKKVSFGCVNTSPEFIIDEVLPRAGTIFGGGKKAMAVVIPDQQAMLSSYLTPLTEQIPGQRTTARAAADLAAKEEQITDTEAEAEQRIEGRFRTGEGAGMDKADVQKHIANEIKGWKNAPPVKVIETENQLPKYLQEQIKNENIVNPKGVWDPRTQSVFLISSNLTNNHDATYTVLHEVMGHFGLQKILGSKFDKVMGDIYNSNKAVKDRADNKIANGMDKLVAVEEVLAEMAETATNPSLVQKVVNIIRQALRALGFDLDTFTNGEILQLLQDSRKFVTGTAGVPIGGNVKFGAVFNSDAPIFYSQLASMVAGAPKQLNVASKEQWAAWIKSNAGKNQVKEEEIEYSGVLDFLNTTSGKISREDLLEFLNQEGVQVDTIIRDQYATNKEFEELMLLREEAIGNRRLLAERLAKDLVSGKIKLNQLIAENSLTYASINSYRHPSIKVEDEFARGYIKRAVLYRDTRKWMVMQNEDFNTYSIYDSSKSLDKPAIYVDETMRFSTADKAREALQEFNLNMRNNFPNGGVDVYDEYTDLNTQITTLVNKAEDARQNMAPQYSGYTLGSEVSTNYAELILTLLPSKQGKEYRIVEYSSPVYGQVYKVVDAEDNILADDIMTRRTAQEIKAGLDKDGNTLYNHVHWANVNNPLVHVRVDEKTDDKGNRVLFVEELQSDWGQAYAANKEPTIEISAVESMTAGRYYSAYIDGTRVAQAPTAEQARADAIEFWEKHVKDNISKAPFVTDPRSYTALAIKRLLRYAADNGYSKISFISGIEAHLRFPTTQDGTSTKKGMETHYDVRIPSVTKDIFKKLGINPNSRIEEITVRFPEDVYNLELISEDDGTNIEIKNLDAPEIDDHILDGYFRMYGSYPEFTKDYYDPDTQEIFYKKGERLRSNVKLQNAINKGMDLQAILIDSVTPSMKVKLKVEQKSTTEPFFTIDLTSETKEKVKRGQAMFRTGRFSTGAGATFRNNPAAPGVSGDDARTVFDSFADRIESAGILNSERADNLHEFIKNGIFGNARKALLYTLPVKPLTEEAKRAGLKMAPQFNTIIDEQSGYVNNLNRRIEPLVQRAEAWAKGAGQKQLDLFNKVVYDSTTLKADPTKPKKADVSQADYDLVKNNYDKLGGAGKSLYVQIRDAYAEMYQEILDSIEDRINTFEIGNDAKTKIKQDILDKLSKQGKIDPYFALTRKGKYWLSYNLKNEPYIEAYTTERERTKQAALVRNEGATDIQPFSQISQYRYSRAPSGSFVNNMLKILELNKPKNLSKEASDKYNEAADEVMRLYLSTLPETSFAQSFQKRKETLGFKRDAIEAMRDRMYSTSQQLGRMRYSAKLNKLLEDMRAYSKLTSQGMNEEGEEVTQQDNKLMNEYISVLEKHAESINNPNVSNISRLINSLGFNYLLGLNVSSAVINMGQVPMVVAPYLAGEHGWGETMSAVNRAYKLYLNSGYGKDARTVEVIGTEKRDLNGNIITPAEKVKQRGMPSITNYDPNSAEGKKYGTLIEQAQKQGQVNQSQFYDILEVDGRKNWGSTVNAVTGFAFHHGDRINREVSMVAAYDLQLTKLKSQGKTGKEAELEAANYAIYVTEMTNGGVSAASSPLIAKGNIGRVLFMFKRYGVSMYYMLFKITREALKGETPEIRKAAMSQLAGVYGTSALFSGLQGVPMFGIAAMVYNLFADEDEDDMETATRKYVGEFAYKGMLNYVTGAEVASRFSLSDLIFRSNPTANSRTFEQGLLENIGGPAYGVMSRIKRGLDFMSEGNMERGIENILPSAISNLFKAYRFGTEGAQSLRGDPIVEDINAFSVAAQALGFAPADYVRQLEINSNLKGIEKTILQEKSKLLQKWNVANRMGDTEAAKEYKDELFELNRKHPDLGISEDTFQRSERAFEAATKRTVNGVQFSQKLYDQMMRNAAEYER